jgi:hypothetical protein
MLWIEPNYSVIFGHKRPELAAIKQKRLKTSDPRLVKRFNNRVKQTMRNEGFMKRFQTYKSLVEQSPWEESLITQYDAFSQEDRKIRTEVEDKIRKLPMGGIPWSPKLQTYRDTIDLWRMIARKRKHIKVSVKRIRRFMIRTSIRDALTNDLDQAELLLQQAYKAYKQAKKSAQLWRNNFLEDLAGSKAEAKGTEAAKELKSLIQIERQ